MRKKHGTLLYIALTFLVVSAGAKADQPVVIQAASAQLKPLGTTYSRAQSADWLDENRFVVGRWDGTISVFRQKSEENEFGPVLVQPLSAPSRKAVELVAKVNEELFITSNDSSSLVVWRPAESGYKGDAVFYDSQYGVAVSAAMVKTNLGSMVAVGHTEGFVSFWSLERGKLRITRAFSIRSPNPIQWQWQTWHVRGIASYSDGKVITVSEDGDACLISVPDGKVLYRQRYNSAAQRGINDVAVHGDMVALVNCSVGEDDKNFWVYRIHGDRLKYIASEILVKDTSRAQVFTFSVELVPFQNELHFLASTEEGLLWLGRINEGMVHVDSELKVAVEGGAVLALHREPLAILSVAHKIQTFTLGPKPLAKAARKAATK